MNARRTKRAAIYARISADSTGRGEGVDRQLVDARERVAYEGWSPVGEFTDNDISAYRSKHRPGYEALMTAVQNGEVDIVVVYQSSRLWRSRTQRAEAMEIFQKKKVMLAAVSGTDLDFATASGRMIAGIMGEFDTGESAVKSERIVRQKASRRRAGHRVGGPPPWCYRNTKTPGRDLEWVDDPATLARGAQVYRDYVAGRGLPSIARDLNRDGVPTVGGASGTVRTKWTTSSLSHWMRSGVAFGRMKMKDGDLPHLAEGLEVPQDVEPGYQRGIGWDPLPGLEGEEGDRLWREYLARSGTAKWPTMTRSRVGGWMLAEVATCGLCGSRMWVSSYGPGGRVVCRGQKAGTGCPGTSVYRTWLEKTVVYALASSPALSSALVETIAPRGVLEDALSRAHRDLEETDAELDRLDAAVGRLASEWAMGNLEDGAYRSATAGLDARRLALTAKRAEISEEAGRRRADMDASDTVGSLGELGTALMSWAEEGAGQSEADQRARWSRALGRVLAGPETGGGVRIYTDYIEVVPRLGGRDAVVRMDRLKRGRHKDQATWRTAG